MLDLFEIVGEQRDIIESRRRPENVHIQYDTYGSAVIRDQKPLLESTLSRILDGMTIRQYYKLLNRKTFFWVQKERLERHMGARANRMKSHIVLTVDTEALLESHEKEVYLSHINSGAAIYASGRRGKDTFQKLTDYPFLCTEKEIS